MPRISLNKNGIATTIVVLLAFFFIFSVPSAEAQQNNTENTESTETTNNANTNTQPSSEAKVEGNADNPSQTATALEFSAMAEIVYKALNAIGSLFSYLGGSLLDISLSWFVLDMPGTVSYFGIDDVLVAVWQLVRDLFNLAFIFGLIYIGFRIILGIDESGAKRNIGTLVIAALLINFSLYLSQVIIDFGNLAATQIGQQFSLESGSEVLNKDIFNIADGFVAVTNIEQLKTTSADKLTETTEGKIEFQKKELGVADALIMGLSICLMLMLLGFVFAAGAILMFIRFMKLILFMMFSPILFLGLVLPDFKSQTQGWWKDLIKQSIIGPAYLFMLYVSLLALQTMASAVQVSNDAGLMAFVMLSVIVAGFAWASLMVAQNLGATGASQAMSFGSSIGKKARGYVGVAAGGATFGLVAAGTRSTFGKWSHKHSESDGLKTRMNEKGVTGWLARREMDVMRLAGDSSFDLRKISGAGATLGIGEGRKGGYKTKTEELIKKEKEYAESLGKVEEDDPVVMKFQNEVDATEQAIKDKKEEIRNLQKSKRGASKARKESIESDIDAIKSEIEKHEEDLKKQKEVVQREVYRYQVGSSENIDQSVKDSIKNAKESIKILLRQYEAANGNPRDQEAISDMISKHKKALAGMEKMANQQARGYATVVEEVGRIRGLFIGRSKHQSEKVGEELRDEYMSKIKGKDK